MGGKRPLCIMHTNMNNRDRLMQNNLVNQLSERAREHDEALIVLYRENYGHTCGVNVAVQGTAVELATLLLGVFERQPDFLQLVTHCCLLAQETNRKKLEGGTK